MFIVAISCATYTTKGGTHYSFSEPSTTLLVTSAEDDSGSSSAVLGAARAAATAHVTASEATEGTPRGWPR